MAAQCEVICVCVPGPPEMQAVTVGAGGILEGVTRDTVLRLAAQLELRAEERAVDPTELYVADELFFVGTHAEVMPISEIDHYRVGEGGPGPVTRRLQSAYDDVVRGRAQAPAGWHTPVYAKVTA